MSSWISTVLPTPAPPKRPILPPLAYGASRSTTLMPVTRISASVDCSTKGGAGWWMARVSSCGTGPASSTGWPTTFMMRPSVPSPTGTEIGPPVSPTAWPRTRPSVVSIAMVRTVFSPRCWATSSTSRLPWLSVSSAFRIAGRCSSSNCTSTTAPMTWATRPLRFAASAIAIVVRPVLSGRSERLRARDDLDEFLGDLRLAGAVVVEGEALDHVAGVARGVVHGGHLRAAEGGRVFEQRAEDLHREVARQKILQDLLLARLVFVDGVRPGLCARLKIGRAHV